MPTVVGEEYSVLLPMQGVDFYFVQQAAPRQVGFFRAQSLTPLWSFQVFFENSRSSLSQFHIVDSKT
jgi:hypothetical protein